MSAPAINRAAWTVVNDQLGTVLRTQVGAFTLYVDKQSVLLFHDKAVTASDALARAGRLDAAAAMTLSARLREAAVLANGGTL